MRSYDSPGDVVTITVDESERDFYASGDMNINAFQLQGVTEGPADPETGLLNVAVKGVFNRTVANPEEYAFPVGTVVFVTDENTLFPLAEIPEGGFPFGYLLDNAEPGTSTCRVRLMG